jgi:geranylgeranyl diphosphate synthase type II
MHERGSIAHARAVAAAMAGAAEHEFAAVYGALPPSEERAFLGGLVRWVFDRT